MNIPMNNRNIAIASTLLSAAAIGAYAILHKSNNHSELPVEESVDLDRYLGEWYEIAHLPFKYEKGCYGVKAIYAKRDDGDIDVLNICHKDSLTGELDIAKGKACVVDKKTNAKLKVTFAWPFSGDYWILKVGKKYDFALVGTPDRDNLWILSRTPEMDQNRLEKLRTHAQNLGFDTSKLIYTTQVEA
ncbi:lipocalin family protein [Xanthocytophaga agilis]|uniref:Lipocalin family protein n=1 Tax=Xanthocytophaga agilis TaxID=3048010 RepID=A0AAE3QYG5_9BACT|nr:lipocalin family protein [Xanthocytophaga agilis]MDJ1500354.1 lipocalin family protein [Xanthocytophaga agilis]